jgi:hypothetical protein
MASQRRYPKLPGWYHLSLRRRPHGPAQIEEFLYALSGGCSIRNACLLADLPYTSMVRWLKPGNARHKPDLVKRVEAAKQAAYAFPGV